MSPLQTSLLAILLFVSACMASHHLNLKALSPFGNVKNQARSNGASYCCYPEVYSAKSAFNLATNGSTANGIVSTYTDLVNQRMRTDVVVLHTTNPNQAFNYTSIVVTINSTPVSYFIYFNGQCSCILNRGHTLPKTCYPTHALTDKVDILGIQAAKFEQSFEGDSYTNWVGRTKNMPIDQCYPLSYFSYAKSNDQSSFSQFYDFVGSVDPKVFTIPTICPPVNQCQP